MWDNNNEYLCHQDLQTISLLCAWRYLLSPHSFSSPITPNGSSIHLKQSINKVKNFRKPWNLRWSGGWRLQRLPSNLSSKKISASAEWRIRRKRKSLKKWVVLPLAISFLTAMATKVASDFSLECWVELSCHKRI